MRLLLCLFLSALLNGLSAQTAIDTLDLRLEQLAASGHFSGNLLLAEGNNILLRKSYGPAQRSPDRPLNPESIFELASVSKQFTAAAIAQLIAEEKIELNAPAMAYLPELERYPLVTVAHLIHHQSGLADYFEFAYDFADSTETLTNQTILNILRDEKLATEFAPGDAYSYSNTGYLLLASIIERVSGLSFGEYLSRHIFEPLGMKNTFVYRRRYAPREVDNYAYGYVWTGEEYLLPDSIDQLQEVVWMDGIVGDGMVNSNLDDLRRWDRALADNQMLDTSLLFTRGVFNDGQLSSYGFGWVISQHPERGYTIAHSGGWPGYNTFIYRFPETDRLMILLRNDDGGKDARIKINRNVLLALFNKPLDLESLEPLKSVGMDTETMKDYFGVYAVVPEFKLTFFEQEGVFMTQATGQGPLELVALEAEDRFALLAVEAEVQFHRDDSGNVTSLTLYQAGQEIAALRE